MHHHVQRQERPKGRATGWIGYLAILVTFLLLAGWPLPLQAQLAPQRSWTDLVSSNGYTGVVVDLARSRIHHFREHPYATEEPRWTAEGEELWLESTPGNGCWQPQVVYSRDLLYDAYFGLMVSDTSSWLAAQPVDLDASGYDGFEGRTDRPGGTGIIRMVQSPGDLSVRATTRVFAPWTLGRAGFVMALEVTNTSDTALGPFHLYGLVNAHLGTGRPGPESEIGSQSETITILADDTLVEQGFAGALYVAPLDSPSRITHTPAAFYSAVQDGLGDLPLPAATGVTLDDAVSGYQWDFSALAAGATAWVGLVVAYHPDPTGYDALKSAVDDWIDGRSSHQLVTDEQAGWGDFMAEVDLPEGLTPEEEDLFYHSAAILRMAQVQEGSTWLRPQVAPGTPRYTGIDGSVEAVALPGVPRAHQGKGAILASLPPGAWSYAWVRDGAYAIVGLVDAGLYDQAREGLRFFLEAQADRYREYSELEAVPLLPYALSLTRYHGFGIEQSDTTCNGDFNFEWDGFGLFLWALRHYVEESGDTSLLDPYWSTLVDGVAEVIAGLVDPANGLIRPDSSIWEVHWLGKEKHFTYTSITAVRGLCDASALALARGEEERARQYSMVAREIRRAIHQRLRAPSGALAANLEELGAQSGFWDAAVIEAVAMGLFDPQGETATATLQALRDHLTTPSGMGLSRNDDATDSHGLTPYGSEYDTLEWIFIDYRASIAARHMALSAYADSLQAWISSQSVLNYLLIAENYDPTSGIYRNNAPMIGFGAGSYLTAMRQRAGDWQVDPACGIYFEQDDFAWPPGSGSAESDDQGDGPGDQAPSDAGTADTQEEPILPDMEQDPVQPDEGDSPDPYDRIPADQDSADCGCLSASAPAAFPGLLLALALLGLILRRRSGRGEGHG
ncbi:MAG: hypothetical protein JW797_07315 [Bradymonadales bacterium]|nr:hypothetical protein [Bradymonadales bacterium]